MPASIKETNYRELHSLKDGDIIQCKDATYTIEGKPIGYGGSSILYGARRGDTGILYAIKEWFPHQNCMQFKRTNGVIQPIKPDDNQLSTQMNHARKNLENEARISQHLFNVNTRTVPTYKILTPISITTGGETHTEVAAGIFSEQLRFDTKAKSLEAILTEIGESYTPKERRMTRGLPNIYLTACLMEEVLRALQQVHNARDLEDPSMQGYYYGDLHPKNVFFAETDIAKKHVGIAHLLDYGSSMALDCNGKTEELIAKSIFSTKGYRPPEANKEGYFKLDKRADIYSAGCLLYRCVVSKAKFAIAENKTSPVLGPSALSEVDGKAIGCSGRALVLLNDILDKATRELSDPGGRYGSIDEMQDAIQRLKEAVEPPKNLLPLPPEPSDSFIEHSRDNEVSVFQEAIKGYKPVFIWGQGGVGKTEISLDLARQSSPLKGAYWVQFQNSMRETILNMNFSGYEPEHKESEEADYQERLKILREQYQDALIIIDNADCPGQTIEDLRDEKSYKDLTKLGIHLVFTTRSTVEWAPQWEVKELSKSYLLQLMRKWCRDPMITDEQLLKLIDAVDGHTLTVALMAKTLGRSRRRITAEQMLKRLKLGILSEIQDPQIRSDQDRGIKAQTYEHLRVLFNLSGMDDDAKCVLRYAASLPKVGMDCRIFENCLHQKQENALTDLLDCGWLKNSSDNVLSIHPVIRAVCQKELIDIDRDREDHMRFLQMLLTQAERMLLEQNANAEQRFKGIRQVIAMCDAIAQRIGIVHITDALWRRIDNLQKIVGHRYLCKQIKSYYLDTGETRIPYTQKNGENGLWSFDLEEDDNIQYVVCTVERSNDSRIVVQPLKAQTSSSGNKTQRTVYFSLGDMSKTIYVYAYHQDIQTMYRYDGYFSPRGVMLKPTPYTLPLYYACRTEGSVQLRRIVMYSIYETCEGDWTLYYTIEKTEEKFGGKVILIDSNNINNVLFSDDSIHEETKYFADFVFW